MADHTASAQTFEKSDPPGFIFPTEVGRAALTASTIMLALSFLAVLVGIVWRKKPALPIDPACRPATEGAAR